MIIYSTTQMRFIYELDFIYTISFNVYSYPGQKIVNIILIFLVKKKTSETKTIKIKYFIRTQTLILINIRSRTIFIIILRNGTIFLTIFRIGTPLKLQIFSPYS